MCVGDIHRKHHLAADMHPLPIRWWGLQKLEKTIPHLQDMQSVTVHALPPLVFLHMLSQEDGCKTRHSCCSTEISLI